MATPRFLPLRAKAYACQSVKARLRLTKEERSKNKVYAAADYIVLFKFWPVNNAFAARLEKMSVIAVIAERHRLPSGQSKLHLMKKVVNNF